MKCNTEILQACSVFSAVCETKQLCVRVVTLIYIYNLTWHTNQTEFEQLELKLLELLI